ncbi:hypothetical protein N0V82_003406 [Gnomoniopsis sp. IMI 355080]|nr:hypothetical protein N0V82_003406 [Gnomoniopsis sp. IMI 355080]
MQSSQSDQSHNDVSATAIERETSARPDDRHTSYQDEIHPLSWSENEILALTQDAAEFNRTINQQRVQRAALMHRIWHKHHEQPASQPSLPPEFAPSRRDLGSHNTHPRETCHDSEQPSTILTQTVDKDLTRTAQSAEVGSSSHTSSPGSLRSYVSNEDEAETIKEVASEDCIVAVAAANEVDRDEQAIGNKLEHKCKPSAKLSGSTAKRHFTPEELEIIRGMLEKGNSCREIGLKVGRPTVSIKKKTQEMIKKGEISSESARRTRKKFTENELNTIKISVAEKRRFSDMAVELGRSVDVVAWKIRNMRARGDLPRKNAQ